MEICHTKTQNAKKEQKNIRKWRFIYNLVLNY
jgi:hypothetical protein